ncbi:MAG: hypothetical protein V3S64_14890 [bacterium]
MKPKRNRTVHIAALAPAALLLVALAGCEKKPEEIVAEHLSGQTVLAWIPVELGDAGRKVVAVTWDAAGER